MTSFIAVTQFDRLLGDAVRGVLSLSLFFLNKITLRQKKCDAYELNIDLFVQIKMNLTFAFLSSRYFPL